MTKHIMTKDQKLQDKSNKAVEKLHLKMSIKLEA